MVMFSGHRLVLLFLFQVLLIGCCSSWVIIVFWLAVSNLRQTDEHGCNNLALWMKIYPIAQPAATAAFMLVVAAAARAVPMHYRRTKVAVAILYMAVALCILIGLSVAYG